MALPRPRERPTPHLRVALARSHHRPMHPFDLTAAIEALRGLPPAAVMAVLFAGALLEYVVPPLPGDTVVVAGAALVTAFGWPLWPVYAASTAGSVVGSAVSWAAGAAFVRRGGLERLSPRGAAAVVSLTERFALHGPRYLVINRFTPGIRTFFFVAAGVAGLRLPAVLAWSALSAAAWNALLIGLGWWVGDNVALLEALLARYTIGVGIVVAVAMAVVGLRVWAEVRGPGKAVS